MKTIAIIRRAVPMSFCGMLIAVGGCAGAPSMDVVSPAEIAVNRAIEAKAGEYAPLELRQAQENLDAARQAINDEEYEQAHRLAEAAREDAPLPTSAHTSAHTSEIGRAAGAREEYDMLCTKGKEVAEKLAMLKTRDDDSWHDLGTGIERTWRDMAESSRDLVGCLR